MRKLRMRAWVGVVACSVCFAAPGVADNAELSFDDRVAAHRAIEEVYWRLRIWPDANPLPKPAFHEVVSEEVLRAKVADDLLRSRALETFWGLRLSERDLRSEVDRMASSSRAPAVLRGLFAALDNQPDRIAECLARPALAQRWIRRLYAEDPALHAAARNQAKRALASVRRPADLASIGGRWSETVWVLEDRPQASAGRSDPRMRTRRVDRETWRRLEARLADTMPAAVQEDDDRFFAEAVVERGDGRLRVVTVSWPKRPFEAWWAEARAALLDGAPLAAGARPARVTTASLIDSSELAPQAWCTADTWGLVAPLGAPDERSLHSAVWTGAEMIVWGGWDGGFELGTGGRYNPVTDVWTPTAISGAPTARDSHTAVWTGDRMVVWGGVDQDFVPQNTGGRYDPVADRWTTTTTTGAPAGRFSHTAVWTGSRMVIWGGSNTNTPLNTGGRYDPVGDAWLSTTTTGAPVAREAHTAAWLGGRMVIWGGLNSSAVAVNTGGRYDPAANTWSTTTTTGAPAARAFHTAVATGADRMIVWGGWTGTAELNTGGIYDPAANSWTATSTTGAPAARDTHTAVWTGVEMVVWGGTDGVSEGIDSGGRYDPASNAWTAMSKVGAPSGRRSHVAVWAISEMLVWGGFGAPGYHGDGRSYCTGTCSATSPTQLATFAVERVIGSTIRLSWAPLAGVVWYDLVGGSLPVLRDSSGDFTAATQSCLANDDPELDYLAPGTPPRGGGDWYLVRGINCAGVGSYDGAPDRQVGSRDVEIDASIEACP